MMGDHAAEGAACTLGKISVAWTDKVRMKKKDDYLYQVFRLRSGCPPGADASVAEVGGHMGPSLLRDPPVDTKKIVEAGDPQVAASSDIGDRPPGADWMRPPSYFKDGKVRTGGRFAAK